MNKANQQIRTGENKIGSLNNRLKNSGMVKDIEKEISNVRGYYTKIDTNATLELNLTNKNDRKIIKDDQKIIKALSYYLLPIIKRLSVSGISLNDKTFRSFLTHSCPRNLKFLYLNDGCRYKYVGGNGSDYEGTLETTNASISFYIVALKKWLEVTEQEIYIEGIGKTYNLYYLQNQFFLNLTNKSV